MAQVDVSAEDIQRGGRVVIVNERVWEKVPVKWETVKQLTKTKDMRGYEVTWWWNICTGTGSLFTLGL